MNKNIFYTAVVLVSFAMGCTQSIAQKQVHTDAQGFQDLMKTERKKVILDVRTAGEFQSGYIPGAVNMDISSPDFEAQLRTLDTQSSVFVYCLAGGRSASATEILTTLGFKKIIDLNTGILGWKQAGFPIETPANAKPRASVTSTEAFGKMVGTDTLTFVDFSAVWCTPCRKIKEYLPELEKEFGSALKIIVLDYDANATLCEAEKITTVPYLRLYRNGKVLWNHPGFADSEKVMTAIKPLISN